MAISDFSASAPVIAGLIIALIAIPAAWATSFLKSPMVQGAAELARDAA
ncbi:hypothetical protein [Nonomuraea basaltis]|nr:hypothetical protein [Nonomuraea basaltis]